MATKKKTKNQKSSKKVKGKPQKLRQKIFIEVLQNGETLGQYTRNLAWHGAITIGSARNAHVNLPYYPLAETLKFIYMRRDGLLIEMETNWEGFVYCGGEMHDVQANTKTERVFKLKKNDYASIMIDDLTVMVRVGPERRQSARLFKRHPELRGKLLPLFFPNKVETQVMFAAFLAAFMFLGPLIYSLATEKPQRPRTFIELGPNYIAGFFDPLHLKTAPEVLQEHIDRSDYFRSTMLYYNALAEMMMGWDSSKKLMFPASQRLFESMHEDHQQAIMQIERKQLEAEEKLLSKQKTAVFSIPSVKGESLQGSILRLFDKINLVHKNAEDSLALRRTITTEFPEDPSYDYTNYKNLGIEKNALAALSKINTFEILTDEETMYQVANNLAAMVEKNRTRAKRRAAASNDQKLSAGPIAIPGGVNYASFLNQASLLAEDIKINAIDASSFGTPSSANKIKEPLIGEISPDLIEKVIDKNKYELQLCFELALRRNQLTDGKMEWSWRIDSRGQISQLELVSTNISDRNMVRCVRQKIAAWSFPRPKRGSVSVTYPFHFSKSRG